MVHRRITWLAVVLPVIAVLACIDLDRPRTLSIGENAPNFGIKTANRTLTLEDLRGRVVVVSFWSST